MGAVPKAFAGLTVEAYAAEIVDFFDRRSTRPPGGRTVVHLPADGRAPALSRSERVRDLHRVRR